MERKFSKKDIESGKVWGALAYIPFLFFLPFILASSNKFALFHAKQGLVLTIGIVGGWLVWKIVHILLWLIFALFGPLRNVILFIADFCFQLIIAILIILAIISFILTILGKSWRIPVLGAYADKMKI